MPTNEELTSWRAQNWNELASIWRELVNQLEPDYEPRFRGTVVSASEAGYVFQTLIVQGFLLSNADIEPPYSVPMDHNERVQHQIDGAVFFGWQGFLIEAKFVRDRVDFGPLARLQILAELRPLGTMGAFFSAWGYTEAALELAHILRPMRVLLFTPEDIEFAITSQDFARALRVKWESAVLHGRGTLAVSSLSGTRGSNA
jgi:hypothetical protein